MLNFDTLTTYLLDDDTLQNHNVRVHSIFCILKQVVFELYYPLETRILLLPSFLYICPARKSIFYTLFTRSFDYSFFFFEEIFMKFFYVFMIFILNTNLVWHD